MPRASGAARSWTRWRRHTSSRGCWSGSGGCDPLPTTICADILPAPTGLPIHQPLMTSPASAEPLLKSSHLLGIEHLSVGEIGALLDLADTYAALNRSARKKTDLLKG